jgi:hypothetical protein
MTNIFFKLFDIRYVLVSIQRLLLDALESYQNLFCEIATQ